LKFSASLSEGVKQNAWSLDAFEILRDQTTECLNLHLAGEDPQYSAENFVRLAHALARISHQGVEKGPPSEA